MAYTPKYNAVHAFSVDQLSRAASQMTIAHAMHVLMHMPGDAPVANLKEPHSYRGYYTDLALIYNEEFGLTTASDLLFMLDGIVGNVYEGYKGGKYAMHYLTPIWIVEKYHAANGRKLLSILPGGGLITCNDHKEGCEFNFFL